MTAKAFVDTNILVYAYDRGEGAKRQRALNLLEELWEENTGVLSTQVLQEFYVNIRRKAARPISPEEAKSLIADYLTWEPIVNDGPALLDAIEIEHRYQLSFWDALIVSAAQRAGASVLYSEDLSHGQQYGSVTVRNPFIED